MTKSTRTQPDGQSARAVFRQIVVPTDLTDRTRKALDLARQLASDERTCVTLLHVIQTIPGVEFSELKPFYEKLRAKALKKMAAIVQRAAAAGDVKLEIAYGPRAETIVNAAMACHADLIVLASHRVNPSMVGRDWGTISYKVGILAQCPVLLVK
jgi:nucleotide-binding universal stress UspA family protein